MAAAAPAARPTVSESAVLSERTEQLRALRPTSWGPNHEDGHSPLSEEEHGVPTRLLHREAAMLCRPPNRKVRRRLPSSARNRQHRGSCRSVHDSPRSRALGLERSAPHSALLAKLGRIGCRKRPAELPQRGARPPAGLRARAAPDPGTRIDAAAGEDRADRLWEGLLGADVCSFQ